MYSAMVLLPDMKSGFVLMTNGLGDDARTVLTEVLLKHFTAPGNARDVESYADELARDAAAPSHSRAPDVSAAFTGNRRRIAVVARCLARSMVRRDLDLRTRRRRCASMRRNRR